jgi:hypothetical protein
MSETPRHINDILNELVEKISGNNSIGSMLDALHERGFGVLIFLFALPMALPVPVPPGVNLIFSIPLLLLTFQQIFGAKTPWLPTSIRGKEMNENKVRAMVNGSQKWLDRLSVFIRPRMAWMTRGIFSNLIGLFGFGFALCICVPIPMTNTVPSLAVLLMAVGILMRDGLAVLAGMVIGSGWIMLLATLGIAGFKTLINNFL